MSFHTLGFASIGLALLWSGCATEIEADRSPVLAFDPTAAGPYPVGVATVEVTDQARRLPDSTDLRRFKVEIWYPAEDEARTSPDDVIDLRGEFSPEIAAVVGDIELVPKTQPAHRDAPPRNRGGPFPLVLFSHGFSAIRFQSFSLTTHLASHGYIVVAPDHVGSTIFDVVGRQGEPAAQMAENAPERPRDLSLLLDRLAEGDLGGEVTALADLSRVAVVGHSFGAFTSLLITSRHSSYYDPRIRAAVPISPITSILWLFGGSVATVDAPTLYLGGLDDETAPFAELRAGFEGQHATRALIGIEGAGHFAFADFCDPELRIAAERTNTYDEAYRRLLDDGCGPEYIDPSRAAELTALYVGGWLDIHLKGRGEFAASHFDPAAAPPEVTIEVAAGAP